MKKLTPIQASAHGEDCCIQLNGCPNATETTVLCHDTRFVDANSPRRCDARAAYGDSYCHDRMDGRAGELIEPIQLGYLWGRATARTHVRLMQKGLLTFEGVTTESKILPRR